MTQKQAAALADVALQIGRLHLRFAGALAELDPRSEARDFEGRPMRTNLEILALAGGIVGEVAGDGAMRAAYARRIDGLELQALGEEEMLREKLRCREREGGSK